MKQIKFTKKLALLAAACLTLSTNIYANTKVIPETMLSLAYPAKYDYEICEKTAFSGPIKSLALPNIPLSNIISHIDKNPLTQKDQLTIEFIQKETNHANIKIDADIKTLKEIEKKLTAGTAIKLTEFYRCADFDNTFDLVDNVNFTPTPKNLAPEFHVLLERADENDIFQCVFVSQVKLGDLVKEFHPNIDLNSIEPNISVESSGWTKDGKLHSKTLHITFSKKDKPFEKLDTPRIEFKLPKELIYSLISGLQGYSLNFTVNSHCRGDRLDYPLWVYDYKVTW